MTATQKWHNQIAATVSSVNEQIGGGAKRFKIIPERDACEQCKLHRYNTYTAREVVYIKHLLFTALLIPVLLLSGCDPFTFPDNEWYAEEIGVWLQFDEATRLVQGIKDINGVLHEVRVSVGPSSTTHILWPNEDGDYSRINDWDVIYRGFLRWQGKNTLILHITAPRGNGRGGSVRTGETYTFVRVAADE
jgi:hypothetical protein